MNHRICVAGNIVVDRLYPVRGYPARGQLTQILDGISLSTGGAVPNTGIDLASLLPQASVRALGFVGRDPDGDFAVERMTARGLDCAMVRRSGRRTAFTDVMSDVVSRERTFFTHAGANADLVPESIPFDEIDADLFHIGYILLLDGLDAPDGEYGTKMARVLAEARRRGLRTSIDVVTETGDRFARLVPPALRYTDYCVINELEAAASTGIALRGADGTLCTDRIPAALAALRALGVAEWAVIHAPEGGWGMDRAGRCAAVPSLRLPDGFIEGTVGAGDAFCAGVLAAAEEEMTLPEALRLGAAAAAMSLSRPGATEGVGTVADAEALIEKYGF